MPKKLVLHLVIAFSELAQETDIVGVKLTTWRQTSFKYVEAEFLSSLLSMSNAKFQTKLSKF